MPLSQPYGRPWRIVLETQLDQIRRLEEEIKRLSTECKRLQKENDRLRAEIQGNPPGNPPEVILQEHAPGSARKPLRLPPSGTTPTPETTSAPPLQVTSASSPDDKIALFRRLFRGRDDVYAKRWESKSGRPGYSPACDNVPMLMRMYGRRVRGYKSIGYKIQEEESH